MIVKGPGRVRDTLFVSRAKLVESPLARWRDGKPEGNKSRRAAA
jgi:hypothetical protein